MKHPMSIIDAALRSGAPEALQEALPLLAEMPLDANPLLAGCQGRVLHLLGRDAEARHYLEKAAAGREIGALTLLGQLWLFGLGGESDRAKARDSLHRAAFLLNEAELTGLRLPDPNDNEPLLAAFEQLQKGDWEQTRRLLLPSAAAGNAGAQWNLGQIHQQLNGPTDRQQMFLWWALAGWAGDEDAQVNLAQLCWDGDGAAPDRVLARRWAELAAAQGDEDGRTMLARMDAWQARHD